MSVTTPKEGQKQNSLNVNNRFLSNYGSKQAAATAKQ